MATSRLGEKFSSQLTSPRGLQRWQSWQPRLSWPLSVRTDGRRADFRRPDFQSRQDYTFTTFSLYHGVIMPLNIKNAEVERLAAEVSRLMGESKTEAIRRALEERRRRLRHKSVDRRRERVLDFLERSVWPTLPKRERGRRLTRAEEDRILGYGPGGV